MAKMEKPQNVLRNKTMNQHTAFKIIYDSRPLIMFKYQGWYLHKEKETSFLTLCKANFGDWWQLLCSKSGHQHGVLPLLVTFTKEFFFSFLNRMVLFLSSLGLFFFSCFTKTNKELPCVNFVKCTMYTKYGNNIKMSSEMSSCCKNLDLGFSQVWDYDTFLIY